MQIAGMVLILAGLAVGAAGAVIMARPLPAGRYIIVTGATLTFAGAMLAFIAGVF